MSPELLDPVSFFLFTFVLYYMSVLSKRLGEVMKMRRYYYLYYAGMFFTVTGSVAHLMPPYGIEDVEFSGYGFFATGLTLGLIASIKYWGWLLKELIKE